MSDKKQNHEQSKADTLTQKHVPNYLKALNSKPMYDRVGQTFVTFIRKPKEETKSAEESKENQR
jgi:hypothetical protein